jgi:hypothetical protein
MLDDVCGLIVTLIALALPLTFVGALIYMALRSLCHVLRGERDPWDVDREERQRELDHAYWAYANEKAAERRQERLRQERIDKLLEYAVAHVVEDD